MAKSKNVNSDSSRRPRPALTPEARENQLISYAVDLAEQQLLDGTASSQVITHFLKLGTARAKLEEQKLIAENRLLEAKKEAIESTKKTEESYERVIRALRRYNGQDDCDEY